MVGGGGGVVDLPLSLLKEVFQRYLSVMYTDQVVTQGTAVKVAKSVLYKIIFCKNVISNEWFRAPTTYRQILIFIDKFCWFFYHQPELEVGKISVRKIWCKLIVIEIAVQ